MHMFVAHMEEMITEAQGGPFSNVGPLVSENACQ
jgi:hypothetical protein